MRPTPAELEVARALIARVKATDPSIKRVDELLVCAAVACRADELGGARLCARVMGKNISRPKQVTDWVARLEKLEQALAAESGSSLLVQPAWIDKNVLDNACTGIPGAAWAAPDASSKSVAGVRSSEPSEPES